MERYSVMAMVVVVVTALVGSASADIFYENRFESEASLDNVEILGTTDYGIVPGAAPCPSFMVGYNILWMNGVDNTYCSVFKDGEWDYYCYSVWTRVTSNRAPYINVFFRVQETGGNWFGLENGYCVHCRYSQNEIELQRIVNGLYTPLATATYDFVPGTWYSICVAAGDLNEMDPTHIRVYVHTSCDPFKEMLIDVHDDAYLYGGVGVGCLSSGGSGAVVDGWFDRMLVTSLDHDPEGPSAVEPATWGGIKSLYR